MNRILSNLILICLISTVVYSIVNYQYGRTYKRTFNEMSVKEQYRELDCLTENIYYEASGEELAGKIAVAQITIQRVDSSKVKGSIFENTICKVVHQKSQFSWVKDKPRNLVKINKRVYNDSREVAKRVLFEGERLPSLDRPNILYYHAEYVTPSWVKDFLFVVKIGKHLYYERKQNGKW